MQGSKKKIQGDEDFDEEENQWTQVVRSKQKSPTKQQTQHSTQSAKTRSENQPTFASITAKPLHNSLYQHCPLAQGSSQQLRRNSDSSIPAMTQKKNLEKVFKTPPPDGPMCDDIVIKIQKINGKPFRG